MNSMEFMSHRSHPDQPRVDRWGHESNSSQKF